jgi:hypothetical protein
VRVECARDAHLLEVRICLAARTHPDAAESCSNEVAGTALALAARAPAGQRIIGEIAHHIERRIDAAYHGSIGTRPGRCTISQR